LKANIDIIQEEKRNAAIKAISHVKDGFIVGLGSGSTAALAIQALGERRKNENIVILGIPTSSQAFQTAIDCKIPITTLDEHPIIDITIDGADQLTSQLFLIKGGGAALMREKIVASASKFNVIIADQAKKAKILGEKNQFVPVEVVPFALAPVKQKIMKLGGKPVIREVKGKLGPVITDNGNAIIDSYFGEIMDPEELGVKLKMIAGVVDTGLFIGLSDIAYVGAGDKVETIAKNRKTEIAQKRGIARL
jgi:ribose 5-phosphate isomerase A